MHLGKWVLAVEAALRLHLKLDALTGGLYCLSKTHKLSSFTAPPPVTAAVSPDFCGRMTETSGGLVEADLCEKALGKFEMLTSPE